MTTCKHEWNNEFSLWDILEIEYTHVLIKIKCSKCGMKGALDSEIDWKEEYWDDDSLVHELNSSRNEVIGSPSRIRTRVVGSRTPHDGPLH